MTLVSYPAHAVHIVNESAHIDINTDKVTSIEGEINTMSEISFMASLRDTASLSGPRVILINSPGGRVDAGAAIIEQLEADKASGVQEICVVMGGASSMAFNILTHCNVRLAVPDAFMVVHKIFYSDMPNVKPTARNLKMLAAELDMMDEPYRQGNSKAMGLTLEQYDRYADLETAWTSQALFSMHYLDGIVKPQ